jgi:hypothetical protein
MGFPREVVPRSNPEVVEEARAIVNALVDEGFHGPINIQGRETEEAFSSSKRIRGLQESRECVP